MVIYASKRGLYTGVYGIDHLNALCGPCTLDQPNDNASLWMSRDME